MKKFLFILIIIPTIWVKGQANDSIVIRKIFEDALMNGKAYSWLYDLTKNIGARISGSKQAADAVEWAKKKMIEAGADTVYLQPVMVPKWVRGEKEKATIVEANGNTTNIPVKALGNSRPTPPLGLTAPVVEVNNIDQLHQMGEAKIKGKIVFYNYPFDERKIVPFEAYGDAVFYRWAGPSEAAKLGAVATICRSMTNSQDDFPHTGAMHYNDSFPQVPCCAISTNSADLLSRILRANKDTKFSLKQSCHFEDSVLSYNVIGEIRGKEFPREYITVGGHLDSWDCGEGAHDDGAGVVQSIEIIRLFKATNIRPKRTIRIVAFMNEENGLRGGKVYAKIAEEKKEKHVAAIESDAGGFVPLGFGLNMPQEKKQLILRWAPLFLPYGIYDFTQEGDGADISPLSRMAVPGIGLEVNSQRYFDFHHTDRDVFENVNKRELLLGAAAMASLTYLLSNYGL